MKKPLFLISLLLISHFAFSQIVIDAGDMPVSGDVFTRSYADILSLPAYNPLTDTGGNRVWNFDNLTPITQPTDTYMGAAQINIIYALTLVNAIGFKVAESIPHINCFRPVSIQNIYSFYELKNNPDEFVSVALGVSVNSFPLPAIYTTPDVVYFLPLIYGNVNYSSYQTGFSIPNILGFVESGSRTTAMDGWGTIVTPYITTPVNCLRVRSEKDEVDSLIIDSLHIPIPNTTVEYKWMVKNIHYPVLQITTRKVSGVEVITAIQYLDAESNLNTNLKAYPNRARDGYVTIEMPDNWKNFTVGIFDIQGKKVASFADTKILNVTKRAKGKHIARVTYGNNTGYVRIAR